MLSLGRKAGMSNGAAVAGGSMVFLAAAATSVVMFGNVGATSNNLPVKIVVESRCIS